MLITAPIGVPGKGAADWSLKALHEFLDNHYRIAGTVPPIPNKCRYLSLRLSGTGSIQISSKIAGGVPFEGFTLDSITPVLILQSETNSIPLDEIYLVNRGVDPVTLEVLVLTES